VGGYGSTRWLTHTAKQTVENSLALRATRTFGPIIPRHVLDQRTAWQGTILWSRGGKVTDSVGYTLMFTDAAPELTLFYSNSVQGKRFTRIELTTSGCNFGGVRWWFQCPNCRRRCGAVYLPPGASRFACRHCHELTYQSQQDRRHYGGVLGGYVAALERATKFEKLSKKLRRGKELTPRQWAFVRDELGLPD
jgi:hypothetical protein